MKQDIEINTYLTMTWQEGQEVLLELLHGCDAPHRMGFSPAGLKLAQPVLAAMAELWASEQEKGGEQVITPNWTPAGVDPHLFDTYSSMLNNSTHGAASGWVALNGYILYRVMRDCYWLDGRIVNASTAAIAMAGLTAGEASTAKDEGHCDPLDFFSTSAWQGQLPRQLIAL